MSLFCKIMSVNNLCTIAILFYCLNIFAINEPQIDNSLIDSAKNHNNLGVDLYNSGKYSLAYDEFKKSFLIKRNILPHNSPLLANAYKNLGSISYVLWNLDSAEIYFKKSLEIYLENTIDTTNLIILYNDLGNISFQKHDFDNAIAYYSKSISIAKNKIKSEIILRNLPIFYINLASSYLMKKDYSKSLLEFETAEYYAKKYNRSFLLDIYVLIAEQYYYQEDFSNTEKYFNQTLSLLKTRKETTEYEKAEIYLFYGIFKQEKKEYILANNYINKSKSIYLKKFGNIHPSVSKCYYYLGQQKTFLTQPDSAIYYFNLALGSLSPDYDPNNVVNFNFSKVQDKVLFATILKSKSDVLYKEWQKTGNISTLRSSYDYSELAVNVIENVKLMNQSLESKYKIIQESKPNNLKATFIAYNLIVTSSNTEYLEKAFMLSEKSKASILLSLIKENQAISFAGIPEELIKKELLLKKKISNLEGNIYESLKLEEKSQTETDIWKNQLFNTQQEYYKIIDIFEQNYPEYYNLKYDTKTTSVKEIKTRLKANETLIEYSMCDTMLFIFLINKNDSKLIYTKLDSDFHENVKNVRNNLVNFQFDATQKQKKSFVTSLKNLYNILLKPLDSQLNDKIIIIPDSELSYIPFEILLKDFDLNNHIDFRKLDYLLYTYKFSYSYSATLFYNQNPSKNSFSKNRTLCIAPIYEKAKNKLQKYNIQNVYRNNLTDIRGALTEATEIAELTRGKLLINNNANESNFKKEAPNYAILHLAMHTVLNDQNPMLSKLIFSEQQDTLEDNLLNAYELYNMHLNNEMIVLSSCNSGDGKLRQGEGIISLARGFFYAGCKSIVMTLWMVNDKKSALLMKDYYRELLKGNSKDASLKEAKIKFIESSNELYAHPFFWSGYLIIGDTSPVFYNKLLLMAALAMVALGIGVTLRLKSKNQSSKIS